MALVEMKKQRHLSNYVALVEMKKSMLSMVGKHDYEMLNHNILMRLFYGGSSPMMDNAGLA